MSVVSLHLKPSTSRKNAVCFSTSALLSTTCVSFVGRVRSSIAVGVAGDVGRDESGWPSGVPCGSRSHRRRSPAAPAALRSLGAKRLGLGVQRVHGGAVGGCEVDAQYAGLRAARAASPRGAPCRWHAGGCCRPRQRHPPAPRPCGRTRRSSASRARQARCCAVRRFWLGSWCDLQGPRVGPPGH